MTSRLDSARAVKWIAALVLGAMIVLPAIARSAAPSTATTQVTAKGVQVLAGSKLWIEGTSTMHAWSSTATRMSVTFAPAATDLDPQVRAGSIQKLEVSVPVAEMRSEKAALDKNMRTALKADKHPAIVWKLTGYTIGDGATPEAFTITATGTLSIAGIEKPVELEAKARREAKGLRLAGTEVVLMSDYGIKPPKMMMGTLRTGDKVTVHFDLLLAEGDGETGIAIVK